MGNNLFNWDSPYDVCIECKNGNHGRQCARDNCTCCGKTKRR
jgi:hypothetical protein